MGAIVGDRWQLQEAKNRLSEVVKKAREVGPQIITVHGTDAVVVVGADQYRTLSRRKGTLVEFFRRSPLVGIDLDLARSGDTGRDVEI
jgi:antitoxin Phd